LSKAETITVFEKDISYGNEGAVATELKAALFDYLIYKPKVRGYICGLGGRNVSYKQLAAAIKNSIENNNDSKTAQWLT